MFHRAYSVRTVNQHVHVFVRLSRRQQKMQQSVGTIASSSSDARLQKIKLILPSSSQGGEEGKKLISPLDWGGEGKDRDFSFALFCSNAFYLCRRCALVRTVRTGGGNVFSRPQRTKRPLRPRTRDGEGKEREGVLGEHCRVHREHTRGERGECR